MLDKALQMTYFIFMLYSFLLSMHGFRFLLSNLANAGVFYKEVSKHSSHSTHYKHIQMQTLQVHLPHTNQACFYLLLTNNTITMQKSCLHREQIT